MKDFFVSYNGKDKEWAEWIAWQLEDAGFTTVIQAWDFRPGGNFVIDMQRAAEEAERTIAVLSQNYLDAMYTQPEWAAAFGQDPTGLKKTLLPVRIQECNLKGMLSQIVYIDLVGKPEDEARELLLAGLQTGRAKPSAAPGFPSSGSASPPKPQSEKPTFPVETAWGEEHLSPEARAAASPSVRNTQIGGVNIGDISDSSINIGGNVSADVKAGGDVVGGDKIVQQAPTPQVGDSPQAALEAALAQWRHAVESLLNKADDLDEDDKEYVQKTAAKLAEEGKKGEAADPATIEGFLKRLGNMVPDIIDLTAKTLQIPFAGVGLVLEKINDRIKLERENR